MLVSTGESCAQECLVCRLIQCAAYDAIVEHGGLLDILGYENPSFHWKHGESPRTRVICHS